MSIKISFGNKGSPFEDMEAVTAKANRRALSRTVSYAQSHIVKSLKENFTYKYPNTNYSNYHMLYSKEGQCVHWAYLYKELLGAVGIPCVYAKSIKQNHAVNIAYLDKKWYFVDPQFVYGYYSFHPATKEWDFQGYTDWIFAEW